MGKIGEALRASTKFDETQLRERALECLKRNGRSPAKAIVSFIDRLHISSEIRALIGAALIKEKALAYLEIRATELRGSGGAHNNDDSQRTDGPAAKPVFVAAHERNRPGNARHGLAEAIITRQIAPKAFMILLSDGSDFMTKRVRDVRAIVSTRAFDQCMAVLLETYVQCEDDTMIVCDILPVDIARKHEAIAREYAVLVARRVEMTARAFVAMKMKIGEASQIEHQVSSSP